MNNKYILHDDELGPIERTMPQELGKCIGPDLFHYWFYVKFNSPASVYEACYQQFNGKKSTYDQRVKFYHLQLKLWDENNIAFAKKWQKK
jgi:hypothetical protein